MVSHNKPHKWFQPDRPRARSVRCMVLAEYAFKDAVRIQLEDGSEMIVRASELHDQKPIGRIAMQKRERRRKIADEALLFLGADPMRLSVLAKFLKIKPVALFNILKASKDSGIQFGMIFKNRKPTTVVYATQPKKGTQ